MHAHNPSVYRIGSVFQNKVPFRSDGTEFRPKLSPSARNRRTSDGLPFRRGHPKNNVKKTFQHHDLFNFFQKQLNTIDVNNLMS